MPPKKNESSEQSSSISVNNLRFMELFIDNEYKGLKIEENNTEKLHLNTVCTQTDLLLDENYLSLEKKYKKLQIKYKLLTYKYKMNKLKKKKTKNRRQEIKKLMEKLGLRVNQLEIIRGETSTKTCRRIIAELFPDKNERARFSIKKLGKKKISEIISKQYIYILFSTISSNK